MKRVFAAVDAVAALAALPGAASAQDGPVMMRIAETKIVTIGHRDASVPLSYLGPDGKAQGYSIDICLKIADAAKEELKLDKIEVKFVPLTPQTRIPLLTAGTVDIICESSTHTLGRSRQISFLNTTFLTGSKLLVRKSSGILSHWPCVKTAFTLRYSAIRLARSTSNPVTTVGSFSFGKT